MDPSATIGRAIREVRFKARETGDAWSERIQVDSRERGCYEYYVGLFVFAVLARRFLETTVPVALKPLRPREGEALFEIPASNAQYGLLVERLYSVWRESLRKTNVSYRSIRPELVRAAGVAFDVRASQPQREKQYLRLLVPRWVTKDLFHFLSSERGLNSETGGMNEGRGPDVVAGDSRPEAELTTEDLLGIAERERLALVTPGWLTLYRQAALFESPLHAIVDILGDRVQRTEMPHATAFPTIDQLPLSVPQSPETRSLQEMLRVHRRVLLTAPSGGGKSTLLNALFRRQMSEPELLLQDAEKVAFKVRLKDLKNLKRPRQIAEWIGSSVKELLERQRDALDMNHLREVWRFLPALPHGRKEIGTITRDEIIEEIGKEAVRWFNSEECAWDNILLLLDGYNETSSGLRQEISQALEKAVGSRCCFVITSRPHDIPPLREPLPEFQLRELTDGDIIWYLAQQFPESGQDLFENRIRHDSVLSMVRNPFFLYLVANWIHMNPTHPIPNTHGQLIKWFVEECAYRKRKIDGVDIADIRGAVKDWALGGLAYVMLHNSTLLPGEQRIRYPTDLSDQFSEGWRLHEVLDAAEAEGLLRRTDADGLDVSEYFDFVHDYFRDYFASFYLRTRTKQQLLRGLPQLVEFFIWDEPIIMFFELSTEKEKDEAGAAFDLIRKLDPIFASLCARAWPDVDKERLSLLLKDLCCIHEAPILSSILPAKQDEERLYDLSVGEIATAVACTLERLDFRHICEMVSSPTSPFRLRKGAVRQLASRPDEQSLEPLLKAAQLDYPHCYPVLWALSYHKSPDAWQAIFDRWLSLYEEAPERAIVDIVDIVDIVVWQYVAFSDAAISVGQALAAYERMPGGTVSNLVRSQVFSPLRNALPEPWSQFLELLRDPREEVKHAAGWVLENAKWKPPLEELAAALRQASLENLCSRSYQAMVSAIAKAGESRFAGILDYLFRLLLTQDSTSILRPQSEERILALCSMVRRVCEGLLNLGSPQHVEHVMSLACNPNSWFRGDALRALCVGMASEELRRDLDSRLTEANSYVEKAAAMLAIQTLFDPEFREHYSEEAKNLMGSALRQLCHSEIWLDPARADVYEELHPWTPLVPEEIMVCDVLAWFQRVDRVRKPLDLLRVVSDEAIPLNLRRLISLAPRSRAVEDCFRAEDNRRAKAKLASEQRFRTVRSWMELLKAVLTPDVGDVDFKSVPEIFTCPYDRLPRFWIEKLMASARRQVERRVAKGADLDSSLVAEAIVLVRLATGRRFLGQLAGFPGMAPGRKVKTANRAPKS